MNETEYWRSVLEAQRTIDAAEKARKAQANAEALKPAKASSPAE